MLTSLIFILFTVFDFVFDFWPFFLITPLLNRNNKIRNTFYIWSLWAIIRIFLFFNPLPITKSLLIPEPLSTILFFATGFFVFLILIFVTNFKRKVGD